MMEWLPPIPVAVPLAIAGLLLLCNHLLPDHAPDIIAFLTALFVAAVGVLMVHGAAHGPVTYWFGNWTPRGDLAIGIGFVVDQAGATMTAFIAFLFAATFIFSWGYFEDVGTQYHVMMLVFMGALCGFCLTHDLFNMFVWFEVMGVAAFALTAYALEASALEGALNFTVTNSLGSFLMLAGIGLLYARVGALDFSTLGHAVAATKHDPVVFAAFCALASALLIKGAIVPFHFWLSDAHAVAPSPLSVIFSGIMVPVALFGLMRIVWTVFGGATETHLVIRSLLIWLGGATAIIGGATCFLQRHIKRLLAFSTISHMGTMLVGLACLTPGGIAGLLAYVIGHGLIKGALFMIAGIFLASLGGIDEIGLRGAGRHLPFVGIACALGGVLLGGAPIGIMDEGGQSIVEAVKHIGSPWVLAAIGFGSAMTGAAVLRMAGRVFLGWGPVPGEEERSPTEEEREKANRPVWLMLAPAAVMLALALPTGHVISNFAAELAHGFLQASGVQAPLPGPPPPPSFVPYLSMGAAIVLALYALQRQRIARFLVDALDRATWPLAQALREVHSGLIGDYVTWIVVGLVLLGGMFVFV